VVKPGDPQMLDRYSYVRNNPLRYVDPTGFGLEELAPLVDALRNQHVEEPLIAPTIRMLGHWLGWFNGMAEAFKYAPGPNEFRDFLGALTEVHWSYTDARNWATSEELRAIGESVKPGFAHDWRHHPGLESLGPPFPNYPPGYVVGLPKQKEFRGHVCAPGECPLGIGRYPDDYSNWYDGATKGAAAHFMDTHNLTPFSVGLLPWSRDQIDLVAAHAMKVSGTTSAFTLTYKVWNAAWEVGRPFGLDMPDIPGF
jgi:hypothetical protein